MRTAATITNAPTANALYSLALDAADAPPPLGLTVPTLVRVLARWGAESRDQRTAYGATARNSYVNTS
jgi:hypothetical protein